MSRSILSAGDIKAIVATMLLLANFVCAQGQETSLFRQPPPQAMATGGNIGTQVGDNFQSFQSAPIASQPSVIGAGDIGLPSASWTYSPAPPLRTFRVQDIVTIRVDEIARMQANGLMDSRRNGLYNAVLEEWIALKDGNLRKDRQSSGDPEVSGQTNQLYRANAAVQSRESLAFNVAARVVDIQPNGNLVLEANKTIWMNDNIWETSLSGICRAQDIAPDNIILSRDLIDLKIRKNETGEVRDGYKRGWLTRWINEFNPL